MREMLDESMKIEDKRMRKKEIIDEMKEDDVMVKWIKDVIEEEVIEKEGKNMKMIENFGKGVDNIDVDEEERRGIKVKNKKNVMKEENEEMKMEMIL